MNRRLNTVLQTIRFNWVELAVILAVTAFVPSFIPLWGVGVLGLLLIAALGIHIGVQRHRNHPKQEGDR